MPFDFSGKTALITGASKGIGAAAARAFAKAGANVVLFARSKDAIEALAQEINRDGGQASACAGDVALYEDVADAVRHATATFGSLDILVNNAGLIDPIARLADSDPDAWGTVVDVNLKGVYHGIHAAAPAMKNGGTIINISSGAATGALEGWSHYCATKAAVLSLTRCADKELTDQGIRVVGLSPGTVATDMQREIKASGINPVSQLDFEAHIPPEEAAHAILYLASAEAADLRGEDFSIKTPEGRARAGLPPR